MKEIRKVLLIHPEISRTKYNFAGVIDNEPLELEYIAALLRERGVDYAIWDGQVERISAAEKLKAYMPDLVYVCGRTRQERFMLEYCQAAKDLCGSVTVIGGLHAQQCYARMYQNCVDYILVSFDIFQLIQLIQGTPPEQLENMCRRTEDGWHTAAPKPFDIQRLPLPDRSYFLTHTDRYRYLELLPCAHVRTAYCCPYRCSFCSRNKLNCGVYTCRDIQDVVEEIARIPCENIYLVDDDFLVDEKRIRQFINLIRERQICKRYVCYGRADFIVRYPELMQQLKEIGFYYILTGLEALDDQHMTAYNKKCDMDCNTKAVEILHNVGIHMMGMFIADLDFTGKDFRSMYRWIKAHKLRHAAVSIFTPELDSPLYQQYADRILTDDPGDWDYLHVVAQPGRLSLRAYYFHYHVLLIRLFLRGWRDGIYDFVDYGYYIRSFVKNMFRFGG